VTLQFVSAERLLKIRERFEERYAAALRTGNHLWIATASYFVQVPPREGQQLDVENMAMDPAFGCYICEQVYDARLASRRCTGEPS
jgi:hypothetical protein